ncbi:LysE family translocator [Rhodophyticola sp.]|uniref:LysE family translocator n=1 Tax=Rhodophyticola sp. TaxID=2680032 RepID=UPI003D2E7DA4
MSDPAILAALTSVATFIVAAGSPGPATLAVAATSMARGRAGGIALGLGLALGLAIWGLVAALGFATLVARNVQALTVLKLLGAAYLFYLAWKSGQSALRRETEDAVRVATDLSRGQLFRRGLTLNLANPKAVLAWVAALALGGGGEQTVSVLVVALCAALGFALYLGYATIFSVAPVMAAYARLRRGFEAAFAVFFAVAGLRLVFWRAAE